MSDEKDIKRIKSTKQTTDVMPVVSEKNIEKPNKKRRTL